jgi:hypothetical protein
VPTPLRTDASYFRETTSKARRPSRPHLTVGLEAFYHHIPLGLVIPEVTEESFLLRVVLTNSLQTSLDPTLYVPLVESQAKIEDLPIVAVVVTDSCPAREALFPSPPNDPLPTMVS